MDTAQQLRAARAMLKLDRSTVAQSAGVSESTVKRLENGDGNIDARSSTIRDLRVFFEGEGLEFVPANGGGAGVRFNKPSGDV